jgi:hypothetical protein
VLWDKCGCSCLCVCVLVNSAVIWQVTDEWKSMDHWCNNTDSRRPKYILGKNSVPVPHCSPRIPHWLAWCWTQASVLKDQWLTTWTMKGPINILKFVIHCLLYTEENPPIVYYRVLTMVYDLCTCSHPGLFPLYVLIFNNPNWHHMRMKKAYRWRPTARTGNMKWEHGLGKYHLPT